jgi:hypothetical protein
MYCFLLTKKVHVADVMGSYYPTSQLLECIPISQAVS